MSDAEDHGPEAARTGIPRDPPDQEATERGETETADAAGEGAEEELPDTDEAGSGPRRPVSPPTEGEVAPPEPEEPTD